jgi:hypothetical protein
MCHKKWVETGSSSGISKSISERKKKFRLICILNFWKIKYSYVIRKLYLQSYFRGLSPRGELYRPSFIANFVPFLSLKENIKLHVIWTQFLTLLRDDRRRQDCEMLLLLHCDTYASESDEAFINSTIDIKHKYICKCWIRFCTSKLLFCILYIYEYMTIWIKFEEKN